MSDELNKLILNAVTSCTLADRGTFYFLFSHVDAGRRSRYTVTYVEDNGRISASPSFGLLVNDRLKHAIAIDKDTVLIVPFEGSPFNLITTNNWKSLTIPSTDPKEVLRAVITGLGSDTKPAVSMWARVRESDHDFVIECEDGEIPVHCVILKSWLFFERLLESTMQESVKKRLHIPYPKEWVEPLVSHLYGEQSSLTFDEATGVIVTAAVYDLPHLHAQAMRRIRQETLDVTKAVVTWKRAFEVKNEALLEYCGAVIQNEMKNMPKVRHLIEEFSQEEFVQLFSDMSLSAQKEAAKRDYPRVTSPKVQTTEPVLTTTTTLRAYSGNHFENNW